MYERMAEPGRLLCPKGGWQQWKKEKGILSNPLAF
jgi:hypothetical protein